MPPAALRTDFHHLTVWMILSGGTHLSSARCDVHTNPMPSKGDPVVSGRPSITRSMMPCRSIGQGLLRRQGSHKADASIRRIDASGRSIHSCFSSTRKLHPCPGYRTRRGQRLPMRSMSRDSVERLRLPRSKGSLDETQARHKLESSAKTASRSELRHTRDIHRSGGCPPFRRPEADSNERSIATAKQDAARPNWGNCRRKQYQTVDRKDESAISQYWHIAHRGRNGRIRTKPDVGDSTHGIRDDNRVTAPGQRSVRRDTPDRYARCTSRTKRAN